MDAPQIVIMVVDDEPAVRNALAVGLSANGYAVRQASSGDEALVALRREPADLVLLDINMPGISGIQTCSGVRSIMPRAGILMITVLDSEDDKIQALEAGADDYITKPFKLRELVARLRAIARRLVPETPIHQNILRVGELELDQERRTLKKAGNAIHVSPTEYNLLAYLMERLDVPVDHATLLRAIWGPEYGGELEYLRTYVRSLRRKIEDNPSQPEYLLTDAWHGYRFCAPAQGT